MRARQWTVRPQPSGLALYFVALLTLLYLPIALLFLFSVHDNTMLSFPLRGLTLDWYRRVLEIDGLLRAARNSLVVALGSGLLATILGTMVAIVVARYQFRGKTVLIALTVMPLIVPFVVLGVDDGHHGAEDGRQQAAAERDHQAVAGGSQQAVDL